MKRSIGSVECPTVNTAPAGHATFSTGALLVMSPPRDQRRGRSGSAKVAVILFITKTRRSQRIGRAPFGTQFLPSCALCLCGAFFCVHRAAFATSALSFVFAAVGGAPHGIER